MSFKTKVLLLKEFPKGYGIGYNRTYVTKKPTRIATIPVGYGDGYGVIMSNQGEALIRGRRVPLVGRVSMDMCTLDVSRIPECEVGDEVVLLGRQGGEYIPANDIAAKAKTISYEVLWPWESAPPGSSSRREGPAASSRDCGVSSSRMR